MAEKPITVGEFSGMNNVSAQPLVRETVKGRAIRQPAAVRAILNMDRKPDGKLVKRQGYRLWKALPGAHSLYSHGGEFLCVAKGSADTESLYRISLDGTITEICPVVAGLPLFCLAVNGRIYLSSRGWNGVYEGGTVREWGRETSDDPADYASASSSEDLMTQGLVKAPFMENLALAGSRIFGTVGNELHYNDPPLAYEMFRRESFYPFPAELVMVAVCNAGLYLASTETTWFVAGFDPEEWQKIEVGSGAIPGTLQYLANFKGNNDVPVWLNRDGVQAGVGGLVLPLTEEVVRVDHTEARAASLHTKDGRYLASMIAPPDMGFRDEVTCEVVRNGTLIT